MEIKTDGQQARLRVTDKHELYEREFYYYHMLDFVFEECSHENLKQ